MSQGDDSFRGRGPGGPRGDRALRGADDRGRLLVRGAAERRADRRGVAGERDGPR
ncbi:hypothetical protein STTU_3013 [Streptomyces sp. Tu6071]|nr:hypothetical protein STTU_3013 [Streptomyces sp. Tu6071]